MKMHELLDRPEKWIQGAYARNREGYIEASSSPHAECFCLVGALQRCYGLESDYTTHCSKLLHSLGVEMMGSVVQWNDTPGRTWEEVHKLLVEADL